MDHSSKNTCEIHNTLIEEAWPSSYGRKRRLPFLKNNDYTDIWRNAQVLNTGNLEEQTSPGEGREHAEYKGLREGR